MDEEEQTAAPISAPPQPPAGPPQETHYLIYCFDRAEPVWDDEHGECKCHRRRYQHRH